MMSVLSLSSDDKKKNFARKESVESVYSSTSRLSLLQKRKRLCPLTGDMPHYKGDKYVTQRVLSAKTHRVKQLQNQLADAHFHLQELSNENRVLRAMQKKQEIALQRYESSNAELPQILNSHNEELRIHQTKFKQLKQQYKETLARLKERDNQLQQLRDEHNHLLELTRDKNLQEREKLNNQVSELTVKVQQQAETISQLQRRIALEAKNFRHQLQQEMNKHKDTRHDLDLAISNADKLSTIIEFKDKMINTAAIRGPRSPNRLINNSAEKRPSSTGKNKESQNEPATNRNRDDRECGDHANISRFCENSRTLASVLSHDEEVSSAVESRSKYARSRIDSTSTNSKSTPKMTPCQSRKNSKSSEVSSELASAIQSGMTELKIFDEDIDFNADGEELHMKMASMKANLMSKVKSDNEPASRKPRLRRPSTDESAEDDLFDNRADRPRSRGRRNSNVSFYENVVVEENSTSFTISNYRPGDEFDKDRDTNYSEKSFTAKSNVSARSNKTIEDTDRKPKRELSNLDRILSKPSSSTVNCDIPGPKREGSNLDRILAGKPLDKYKNILSDIEKSNKVIDKHLKDFTHSKNESDKLVEQLEAVDKMNEYVMSNGDIPTEALCELNNNFKMFSDSTFDNTLPVHRKRSVSGRRGNAICDGKANPFGDASMSNQDLLNDLLGKK